MKERRCGNGHSEEVAPEEGVQAQTSENAQKDTLAAEEVALAAYALDVLDG